MTQQDLNLMIAQLKADPTQLNAIANSISLNTGRLSIALSQEELETIGGGRFLSHATAATCGSMPCGCRR